jgi:hypothetical protein
VKKLGIVIKSPGQTQQFYTLIVQMNKMVEEHSDVDVILFYYDMGVVPMVTKFAMMEIPYAINFDGTLIATSPQSAPLLLSALRPKDRYLYMWDLDWKFRDSSFADNQNIYLNDKIDLISRSVDHDVMIESVWKKPKHIIREFDHEGIYRDILT